MLRIKVIAADINNLSDARYFAAWGVDYMHFDLNRTTLEVIKEMVDWIAGVQIIIEINDAHLDQLDRIMEFDNCHLATKNKQLFKEVNERYPELNMAFISKSLHEIMPKANINIIENSELQLLDIKDESVYILKGFSGDALKEMIDKGIHCGIVVKGSEEEKVGFKSFDDLDEIFEKIEE